MKTPTEQAQILIKEILTIDNSPFWNYVLEDYYNQIKLGNSSLGSKFYLDTMKFIKLELEKNLGENEKTI